MQVVLGGLITLAVAILVEYLRRPNLHLRVDQPVDRVYPNHPAREVRFVRLLVANRSLPWVARWMGRTTATYCTATISFCHLDGQDVFGRHMAGRWSGAPEPVPGLVVLGKERGILWDPGRFVGTQRIDIPVGTAEPLDVAAKFDADTECYGWNNEAYFSDPVWRNAAWRLPAGRYLVRVVVRSQGERTAGLFRLINDVGRCDFRLETALPGDGAA